ncbi:MAG: succinate dehydrogenase [Actinomycetota bacterium]|nr:succinate dehydrogenase [Actinomycetota bacterium]
MAAVEEAHTPGPEPRVFRGSGEVRSWLFMRISGLFLVFLALGHMAIMHVIGGGVDRVNFSFVAGRWTGAFWRTYDWLLLLLALLHGAIGARTTIRDHIRRRGWNRLATGALWTVTGFLLVLGTIVIVTFDAPPGASG